MFNRKIPLFLTLSKKKQRAPENESDRMVLRLRDGLLSHRRHHYYETNITRRVFTALEKFLGRRDVQKFIKQTEKLAKATKVKMDHEEAELMSAWREGILPNVEQMEQRLPKERLDWTERDVAVSTMCAYLRVCTKQDLALRALEQLWKIQGLTKLQPETDKPDDQKMLEELEALGAAIDGQTTGDEPEDEPGS